MDSGTDVVATLSETYKKIFEIPFNSRNKWMMSVIQEQTKLGPSEPVMLIKGAPDVLLPSVSYIVHSTGAVVPFNRIQQERLSQLQNQWSSEGQRVIAVCKRSLRAVKLSRPKNELELMLYNEIEDLTLIGLISIRDPPRADVKEAVRVIRKAGVRVFMVTGDFMITAVAIAKQVLIISSIYAQLAIILIHLFRSASSHKTTTTISVILLHRWTMRPRRPRFRYALLLLWNPWMMIPSEHLSWQETTWSSLRRPTGITFWPITPRLCLLELLRIRSYLL